MQITQPIFQIILVIGLATWLVACGGGGGGGGGGGASTGNDSNGALGNNQSFSGGTIEDLKLLSTSLTFGHLEITGRLILPIAGSETITVGSLDVTTTGSIGYDYSTCEYRSAPSLTINASGDVTLNGDVLLRGRSGTSVSSGAACNHCTGQDGGDLSVSSGGDLMIGARVHNGGGGGASIRFVGFPSSACSAGDSGNLALMADGNLTFNEAEIDNNAGRNFDGERGTSGSASITAADHFTMSNGSYRTTGSLTVTADTAAISGPIYYGTLQDSIGGMSDTTAPTALVLAPLENAALDWNAPFNIEVRSNDSEMGLRSVSVVGFGHDQVHLESEFVNGVLTVAINAAQEPTGLTIEATDNVGLLTAVSVTGLTIAYPQEIEPNNILADAQMLSGNGLVLGDILTGDPGLAQAAVQTFLQGEGDVSWATRFVEDIYLLPVVAGQTSISVRLEFSGNTGSPDIDIYLIDGAGNIVDMSILDNPNTGSYVESIFYSNVTEGENYHLALQAFAVPIRANYRLSRD